MIEKRPTGINLLLLFLLYEIFNVATNIFFENNSIDVLAMKRYNLMWVGYIFAIILLASNIISLFALWKRKRYAVKILNIFFILSVATTFFVTYLILKDNNIAIEIFAQTDFGKNANSDELRYLVSPVNAVMFTIVYAMFFGFLALYVHKQRDYIMGNIFVQESKNSQANIVRLCKKCGKEIIGGRAFCASCGAYFASLSQTAEKKNKWKTVVNIALTLLVIFVIGGYREQRRNSETNKIFNDALKGSETASVENKKYANFLQKSLEYNKSVNEKMFPICTKLDESEILQYSTFKTEESLKSYIGDIDGCIKEYDGYEEKYDNMIKQAIDKNEELMQNEGFSEAEKNSERRGVAETINDSKKKKLVLKEVIALQNYNKSVLKIYNYFLSNFSDYEINLDENGEEYIYFSSEKKNEEYNEVATEFGVALDNFTQAKEELSLYMNKTFKDMGVNVKMADFEEYMQK